MAKEFVHLHLHTDFSLLDGAIKIGPLAKRVAESGFPAVAITDHGNLYGALSFYHKMRDAGVKPIIGMEGYVSPDNLKDKVQDSSSKSPAPNHIVLLARDLKGYHNLIKLSSFAQTKGLESHPVFDRETLARHSEGLIGLSACLEGVPQALLLKGKVREAGQVAKEFEDLFGKGNYFLEIQDHGLEGQKSICRSLVEISGQTGIPLVATNDTHYLLKDDVKAHEVLLCIGAGKTISDPSRPSYGSSAYYLRSPEEMWQLFGEEPSWLLRTQEIAEQCVLEFPKVIDQVPVYHVPEGYTIESYFEKVTWDGLNSRKLESLDSLSSAGSLKQPFSKYQERLQHEIATIKKMGFSGYFLIVWDFIRYAKEKGIPVGPGRGSAAGSLVAYCLQITDVDPLQYDLLFERFLNPERVTMPDIDIDFCVRGRADVIDYVSDLYGRQNVCQIITFGTMASKAVIKDVGRVLELPIRRVEEIARMIPPPVRGRNVSIADAIEQNPDLKSTIENDPQVAELISIARKLEGCSRHTSVHAAGVVISPKPLDDLIPVCQGQNGELTTQFVMSDLEKTGMLKMDFLALTTLTIIEDCLHSIEKEHGFRPDLSKITLTDEKALKLFADGLLNAVFQFESSGMVEICRKFKPESLEDLSALNALYRPGPLDGGMVDDYIERRHGRRKVQYIVPQMREVLENTYGVLVYQEQIMQLAQKLAGYSLGEADLMRRAMGKKKKEEMAKHEAKFVGGSVERGIAQEKAEKIFSLMSQFADYGFNRSHSFAYAYLAYQTAWLKAHYPAHFFAAVLSSEAQNTAKVAKYVSEMKTFGIDLLPPDVSSSNEGFTAVSNSVRYGLAAIKGIGASAVRAIIEARDSGGRFSSVFDLAERVDQRVVNRRVMEALIKSGACDSISANRAQLFGGVEKVLEFGAKAQKDKSVGQSGLFSMVTEPSGSIDPLLPEVAPWSRKEVLDYEKEVMGFYASGHPLEDYVESLKGLATADCGNLLEKAHGDQVAVGGIVLEAAVKTTKKGDRFALFRLEDQFGSVRVICWPEQYNKFRDLLRNDAALLVKGRLELSDEGAATIFASQVLLLEMARSVFASKIVLRMKEQSLTSDRLETLDLICREEQGEIPLTFEVMTESGCVVRVNPSQFVRVRTSDRLLNTLKTAFHDWDVDISVN